MKRYTSFNTAILLLSGTLFAGPSMCLAADTTETRLATQTQQMDSLAGTNQGAVSSRISSDFNTFAGSTANSDALVAGLRSGTTITLASTGANGTTTSTTFTPPTGRMGYGNVYISLALAKQQLANAGITQPTAQQLEAALVGGTVTSSSGQTTTLTGVLQLRAQGMGWGQIAQSYGYKLGPVISGMRSSNAKLNTQAATAASGTTTAATGAGNASAHRSGIVTGAGSTNSGQGYGRGIVTGAGTSPAGGQGYGNAYGRGIVTGAGGAAGQAGAASAEHGKALGKAP